jgi:osmoprotectant transport system ATP-binding protein
VCAGVPAPRPIPPVVAPVIEFEGVTKVFPGGTVAVEDLSLLAPAGRITVVIGPAASGKTVLLRMVNRMLDPSAGRVLLEGVPNTNARRSQLRRGIGYFVQGGLFPHRTVTHNVETVPLLVGADRSTSRQIALALLERVGLSSVFADKYPGQLSAGQQARVGLARALAADPPVLLMDNPFAGLDPAVRGDLQDDLLELQRIAPKTILFTTQDIDEAIKLGDQIAVMSEGRMVQLATPQTLLSHPGSDFVADLLGRDRGIRKLTFLPAGELPLSPAATVQAGTTGFRARAIADSHRERWLLVLDPERRPRGWVDSAVLGPDEIISGSVVHPLGGTFYADESVLAALDAAILSAAGLAVCLGDDGRILGVVSHTEIARYLTGQRPAVPVSNPFPSSGVAATVAAPIPAPAPAPEPPRAPEPPPPAEAEVKVEEPDQDEPEDDVGGEPATAVLPAVEDAAGPAGATGPVRRATQTAPVPVVQETRSAPVPKPATPTPVPEPAAARTEPARSEPAEVEAAAAPAQAADTASSSHNFAAGRWEWNAETGEWVQLPEPQRSEAET